MGREVTKKADQLLNFATANDVLVVTTAGVTKINGETTEDCIEGILNGLNGRVTYGKGNMLMLRKAQWIQPTLHSLSKKQFTASCVFPKWFIKPCLPGNRF